MGGAKRMMEEDEAKRSIALQIALEAGVLEQCEFHDDCTYEGGEEIESAYKLANHKVSHFHMESLKVSSKIGERWLTSSRMWSKITPQKSVMRVLKTATNNH